MIVTDLPLAQMRRRFDARPLNPGTVKSLAASIRDIGIINPLRVRPVKMTRGRDEIDGWEVTAGSHRFEAAWTMNLETVPCIVEADDDLRAELAMIDENLCRANLSAAQEAAAVRRRKEIHVALHPETTHGGDRKSSRHFGDLIGNDQFTSALRQNGEERNDRFTKEAAEASGRSERTIQRMAAAGAALEDDLADIEGTSLDNKGELDALAKMKPEDRKALIERARAGAKVSAKTATETEQRTARIAGDDVKVLKEKLRKLRSQKDAADAHNSRLVDDLRAKSSEAVRLGDQLAHAEKELHGLSPRAGNSPSTSTVTEDAPSFTVDLPVENVIGDSVYAQKAAAYAAEFFGKALDGFVYMLNRLDEDGLKAFRDELCRLSQAQAA